MLVSNFGLRNMIFRLWVTDLIPGCSSISIFWQKGLTHEKKMNQVFLLRMLNLGEEISYICWRIVPVKWLTLTWVPIVAERRGFRITVWHTVTGMIYIEYAKASWPALNNKAMVKINLRSLITQCSITVAYSCMVITDSQHWGRSTWCDGAD